MENFRVWYENENKMVYPTSKSFIKYYNGYTALDPRTTTDSNIKQGYILLWGTGLHLKNKPEPIEVFEADIIRTTIKTKDSEESMLWVVEPIPTWDSDRTGYGVCVSAPNTGQIVFIDDGILEGDIIGDIFSSPEILEEYARR